MNAQSFLHTLVRLVLMVIINAVQQQPLRKAFEARILEMVGEGNV